MSVSTASRKLACIAVASCFVQTAGAASAVPLVVGPEVQVHAQSSGSVNIFRALFKSSGAVGAEMAVRGEDGRIYLLARNNPGATLARNAKRDMHAVLDRAEPAPRVAGTESQPAPAEEVVAEIAAALSVGKPANNDADAGMQLANAALPAAQADAAVNASAVIAGEPAIEFVTLGSKTPPHPTISRAIARQDNPGSHSAEFAEFAPYGEDAALTLAEDPTRSGDELQLKLLSVPLLAVAKEASPCFDSGGSVYAGWVHVENAIAVNDGIIAVLEPGSGMACCRSAIILTAPPAMTVDDQFRRCRPERQTTGFCTVKLPDGVLDLHGILLATSGNSAQLTA
jgi:hypothetical protein